MSETGYSRSVLWIDLAGRSVHREERDEAFWRLYAGGGLAATALLLQHTEAGIDPLGEKNVLIFASSVVAGHRAAALARFTTSAKSPLTGGIGETRTEGPWGTALKACGASIVAITGRSDRPVAVLIEDGAVSFLDASELWGKSVGETTDVLETRLGARAAGAGAAALHVAAIGPAGENQVRFASVVTDRCFQASRMGMGAVMGSKNLKAVVLRGGKPPAPADPPALDAITREFARKIPRNDLSSWQLEPPGFSCWLYLHGVDAALCVDNYSRSVFDGLESFRKESFLERRIVDLPCPGCPNNCIKAIHPLVGGDLDPRASGIHQEVTGAMGPNIGVGDLDVVLRANNLCNQLGMDPTSLGFTISFAMEAVERGVLESHAPEAPRFGNAAGALRLLDDIAHRRGLGDLLAEGSRRAAARLGGKAPELAMEVKGLEMVCFEPRSQTNLALGYAVAPVGPRYDICEHDWDFDTRVGWAHTLELSRTLGILERVPMGYLGPRKVRNFKALHTLWSAADALDLCIFAVAPTRLLSLPEMSDLVAASTGWKTSSHELMRIGARRLHLMRWYNLREGIEASEDRLPARFHHERIRSGPRAGDALDEQAFRESIRTYYRMMGWDDAGRPTAETLYDYGIEWVLGARS